ncbi:hypothetical protein HPB47_008273 [Ixodes persulcatus]|uniref:Uncharacterized protein n=1 Tax=Ixodes persulcatus TaxID=34615 RepID=A0AC60P567_IXOPE|nr:hypothetical protein HPB47_008273 [Ixodes persulcatus]
MPKELVKKLILCPAPFLWRVSLCHHGPPRNPPPQTLEIVSRSRSRSNSVLNSVPQASETVCGQLYWSRSLSMEVRMSQEQLRHHPAILTNAWICLRNLSR